MEGDTLCEQLALAMNEGPCCWCCVPCQQPGGGVSCCCSTGTCTQPCCVPREHEFAGELWFQQQSCDKPKPVRKMGLLEDPPGEAGPGRRLEGPARLGVLQDRGSASSADTGGRVASCCSGKGKVSRMGLEVPDARAGVEQSRGSRHSDNSVFEGHPPAPLDVVLQALMHQRASPQEAPQTVAPQIWKGQAQRGFGASLPESNYLLEGPSGFNKIQRTPDGALAQSGAVAGHAGIAYPLPAKQGGRVVREIISNLRMPDSKAPANRFMYAQVFNGSNLGMQTQVGGGTSLAGILDSSPSRILRKAVATKEVNLGLATLAKVPNPGGFAMVEKAPQQGGSDKEGPALAKHTPAAVLAGSVETKQAKLGMESSEGKRKCRSSTSSAKSSKRPKPLNPALTSKPSDPSLNSKPVHPPALSNSSSSSSDEAESSGYDPSTAYRVTVTTGAAPSNAAPSSATTSSPSLETGLPDWLEDPLPRTGSTLGPTQEKDLPFSPESSEARCCRERNPFEKTIPEGFNTVPLLGVVPTEGGANRLGVFADAGKNGLHLRVLPPAEGAGIDALGSPGSTGSEIVTEGHMPQGEDASLTEGHMPQGEDVGLTDAEQLSAARLLFEGLRTAKVAGSKAEGLDVRVLERVEEITGEASGLSVGRLSLLSDTPDLLLKALTSGLSARDLAAVESSCRFFRIPATFSPDASMPLTVVAAYRSCQAHPVYKACSPASQERLLRRCQGDWKLALHHLNALDRARSTDEGLVRAGPDYSCVVNTSGELRMFGGSKTRFACLGARDVEELWEQRTVYHDLADKKVTFVDAGPASVVAVTSEGSVYSFGKNEHGCLGVPVQEDVPLPLRVTGLDDIPITRVACGARTTAFLSREGRVYTCGTSPAGGLGLGPTVTVTDVPVMVEDLADVRVVQICAGWDHFLAVTDKGEVYAWGEGGKGQLGQGAFEEGGRLAEGALRNLDRPQRVSRLADHFGAHIVQAAAGLYHSVALSADGRVFIWGIPPNGIRTRDVEDADTVVQELQGLDGIRPVHVAAGALTTFVVGDLGEVYSFGCCYYGELGLNGWGLVTLEPIRVKVLSPHKIVQVSGSWFRHTMARTFDGEIVVMGLNSSGQLGIPFTEAHAGVWKPKVIGRTIIPQGSEV